MSLTFSAKDDKARIIDAVELVINTCLMPGLTSLQRSLVKEHISLMRNRTADISVHTTFNTNPLTDATGIDLMITFANQPPPLVPKS